MDSSGQRVLAFSTPPDFENPSDADRQNDYELTVIATDEDSLTDRLEVTVTVTNECTSAGEPPCAPGRPSVSSVVRHQPARHLVHSQHSLQHFHHRLRPTIPGVRIAAGVGFSRAWPERTAPISLRTLSRSTTYEVQVRASKRQQRIRRVVPVRHWQAGPSWWRRRRGGGGGGGTPLPTGPSFADGASTSRSVAVPAPPGDRRGRPRSCGTPANLDIIYSLITSVPVLFTVDEMTGQIRLVQDVSLVSGQTYRVTVNAHGQHGCGGLHRRGHRSRIPPIRPGPQRCL